MDHIIVDSIYNNGSKKNIYEFDDFYPIIDAVISLDKAVKNESREDRAIARLFLDKLSYFMNSMNIEDKYKVGIIRNLSSGKVDLYYANENHYDDISKIIHSDSMLHFSENICNRRNNSSSFNIGSFYKMICGCNTFYFHVLSKAPTNSIFRKYNKDAMYLIEDNNGNISFLRYLKTYNAMEISEEEFIESIKIPID